MSADDPATQAAVDFGDYMVWLLDRLQATPNPKEVPVLLRNLQDIEPITTEYLTARVKSPGSGDLVSAVALMENEQVGPSDIDHRLDIKLLGALGGVDDRCGKYDDEGQRISLDRLNERYFSRGYEAIVAQERQHFAISRLRYVNASARRGHVRHVYSVLVEAVLVGVEEDRCISNAHYFGWTGSKWRYAGTWGGYYRPNDPWCALESIPTIELAHRIAFVRRYDWHVSLGYVDGPTLSFVTDPVGVREAFRLRDIPNGKSRRAALKHWVNEHWRKRREDPQEATKVRAHLRGAEQFTWNGMVCRVRPSQFDLERVASEAGR